MIIFATFHLLLHLYVNLVKGIISPEVILEIMEQFEMANPSILVSNGSDVKQHHLFKLFKFYSSNGNQITFKYHEDHRQHSILIFSKIQDFSWNFETTTDARGLVISEIQNETELKHIYIPIDIEMYFLDTNSLNVYETYTINNIHVTNLVGKFTVG